MAPRIQLPIIGCYFARCHQPGSDPRHEALGSPNYDLYALHRQGGQSAGIEQPWSKERLPWIASLNTVLSVAALALRAPILYLTESGRSSHEQRV